MEPMQPSNLDMPPLEDRPSLAERVAKLEAQVAVLEAALVEKLTVKVYTETPDYLKPPFKVT